LPVALRALVKASTALPPALATYSTLFGMSIARPRGPVSVVAAPVSARSGVIVPETVSALLNDRI
jgi:hypothetical protein